MSDGLLAESGPTTEVSESKGWQERLGSLISDEAAAMTFKAAGLFIVLLFLALIGTLVYSSWDAIKAFGINFIGQADWNPVDESYGALTFVYGTVVTSLGALAISAPLCIALALFTTELCPQRFKSTLKTLIELLAAIPSIVYGLWALFVLAPLVKNGLYPLLNGLFPNFSLFKGPSFGLGIITSSIILAIMIAPIITTITIEVFKAIPPGQRYAALALGATRWEMMKIALIRPGARGILGALILGLGRALGETMAVAMVIGNSPEIAKSIFGPGATMASIIANEYAEAIDDLHLSSLTYVALLLFLISFGINYLAKVVVQRTHEHGV